MIHEIKGNLLNTHCQYICHQVNCMGKMNSGVAKAIREKWPIVFDNYEKMCESWHAWAHAHYPEDYEQHAAKGMLGQIQFVPLYNNYFETLRHPQVINMFAQGNYGYDGKRYTSYDAFWMCLGQIKNSVQKGSTIAFPHKIGSDRGGANWNVIKTMITEVLSEDYEVYIYELEEK